MTAVTLDGTPVKDGCVGCGSRNTTVLHPYIGRLCDGCPSWRLLPVHLAWRALGEHLRREIDARFARVAS
jgi:hypothetical protein